MVTNQPTFQTGVVNNSTVLSGVLTGNTTDTGITNFVTAPSAVTAKELPNARIEGLWVANIFPWQLDNIWGYVSIVKSNVAIQNI